MREDGPILLGRHFVRVGWIRVRATKTSKGQWKREHLPQIKNIWSRWLGGGSNYKLPFQDRLLPSLIKSDSHEARNKSSHTTHWHWTLYSRSPAGRVARHPVFLWKPNAIYDVSKQRAFPGRGFVNTNISEIAWNNGMPIFLCVFRRSQKRRTMEMRFF